MEKLSFIKKTRPVILIILIALIAYLAIKGTIEDNQKAEALRKEYPDPGKGIRISGIVKTSFSDRGALYISLEKNGKYCFSHSRNFAYDPPFLEEFIQNGDSILKNVYSDTLYIFRDDEKYYFIIGEFLGKDPRKKLFNVKH